MVDSEKEEEAAEMEEQKAVLPMHQPLLFPTLNSQAARVEIETALPSVTRLDTALDGYDHTGQDGMICL
jgi:hypothetical protein